MDACTYESVDDRRKGSVLAAYLLVHHDVDPHALFGFALQ